MEKYIENLLSRIGQSTSDFANRIVAAKPAAKPDVGHYSNAAFLLRSYAGFRIDDVGEEVAITVDVKRHEDGKISIDSDICMDDGSFVMTGPQVKFSAAAPNSASNEAITQWQAKFEQFLRTSEPVVLAAISTMVAPPAPEPEDSQQNPSMF
jgi:hypothetical protein